MSRQKLPVRAVFRKMAHSPNHEYPFHLLGVIPNQDRIVITGFTEDQARQMYNELSKIFNNDGGGQTSEVNSVQHQDLRPGA